MKTNKQNITILCSLVEQAADHRISTSSDFAFLSGCIQGRLKQTVSVSTLERIWGYVDSYQNVRESTLDILARFAGFPDWKTFVADYCNVPSAQSSHRIAATSYSADQIPQGTLVAIEWNPNRHCLLLHLGDGRWRVEQSINSKLSIGDTFSCQRFILNEPLYLNDFKHGDDDSALFVVGNRGGLTKFTFVKEA